MGGQKEILICGLKGCNNLGDQAILQCTEKLILNALDELGSRSHLRLRTIDFTLGLELGAHNSIATSSFSGKVVNWIKQYLIKRIAFWGKDIFIRIKLKNFVNKTVTSDTASIVFAGGGIIKYKYQKFYIYIDEFTKRADTLGIPILFSGVGIEGYDISDLRCGTLARALHRSSVKIISTRDDYIVLKNCYFRNGGSCRLLKVSDPVCNIKKLLSIPDGNGTEIGLGICRFEIFEDNNIDISREQILEVWKNLIEYLESRKLKWKVFTTGLPCDYIAEMELKRYLGAGYPESNFLPRPLTINELLHIISNFKATCVCRLHASIISFSLDVPTMAFVWNDKQAMFAKDIEWDNYFLSRPRILEKTEVRKAIDNLLEETEYKEKSDDYMNSVYIPVRDFIKEFC